MKKPRSKTPSGLFHFEPPLTADEIGELNGLLRDQEIDVEVSRDGTFHVPSMFEHIELVAGVQYLAAMMGRRVLGSTTLRSKSRRKATFDGRWVVSKVKADVTDPLPEPEQAANAVMHMVNALDGAYQADGAGDDFLRHVLRMVGHIHRRRGGDPSDAVAFDHQEDASMALVMAHTPPRTPGIESMLEAAVTYAVERLCELGVERPVIRAVANRLRVTGRETITQRLYNASNGLRELDRFQYEAQVSDEMVEVLTYLDLCATDQGIICCRVDPIGIVIVGSSWGDGTSMAVTIGMQNAHGLPNIALVYNDDEHGDRFFLCADVIAQCAMEVIRDEGVPSASDQPLQLANGVAVHLDLDETLINRVQSAADNIPGAKDFDGAVKTPILVSLCAPGTIAGIGIGMKDHGDVDDVLVPGNETKH